MSTQKISVVGGGIAGLTAAYQILQTAKSEAQDIDLTVFESSGRPGGKLRTSSFAGFQVDEGADAFITRVPFGTDLAQELGISDNLVYPATSQAFIWRKAGLKPMLKSQILGVPLDPDQLQQSGLVSDSGVEAARRDWERGSDQKPWLAPDATVGSVVRQRLGDEIAETLVFPLIGSINAGNCDLLDVRSVAPLIAEAAKRDASLIRGLISLRQESNQQAQGSSQNPIFSAPKAGMEEFAKALVKQLGDRLKLNHQAESVDIHNKAITFADKTAPTKFDVAVLATPAWATATMLESSEPAAAELLSGIDYCSVAIVTLAFDRKDVPGALNGSGFVVPRETGQPLAITACSWASSKWSHLSGGTDGGADGNPTHHQQEGATASPSNSPAIFRVSLGRHQADALVSQSDEAITQAVLRDLQQTLKITALPMETRISRWEHSFPQYAPGHQKLVEQAENLLRSSGVLLAGAGYHGIGVPACIASGRKAGQAALSLQQL